MFKLTGEKIYLVPFEDEHLNNPTYLAWLSDFDVMKTINRYDYLLPVSFEEVKEYFNKINTSKTDYLFAIIYKTDNSFIGTLKVGYINLLTKSADIGIMIGDKTKWGKGVGTESIFLICNYLFSNLGFRKLTSGMMDGNPGMKKVFEKLGFKIEGVFRETDYIEGKYLDHIYMGCFKEEFINTIKK